MVIKTLTDVFGSKLRLAGQRADKRKFKQICFTVPAVANVFEEFGY